MPPTDPLSQSDFGAAWEIVRAVPGWLKEGQARLLFDYTRALPRGAVVLEIGSHRGKSSVVLAKAVQAIGGRLICIDPFVDGRLFGGSGTRRDFERNIAAAEVDAVVELITEYSTEVRPHWDRPIDLLYIDGKHDYWTFSDDLRWSEHLPPGAPILVHDAFSSIGVTLGILARVLPSRTYRYVERSDSMAVFCKGPQRAADRWNIVREMPWWLRNVGFKVLLRLRLRRVARWLGHDSPYDPY
jgi:hypothetical protein